MSDYSNPVADQPLVSIVTPSFNQASFLDAALNSVFAQDYPEIEMIVVDGGSTDGSLEIIRGYSDRLAWWVSEPDQGQASALIKGFSRARGDIFAWLNSDDLLLPGAVREAVDALESNPGDGFVYGDAITIDAQGCPLNRLAFSGYTHVDLMSFRIICQPSVFMRRAAYERVGGIDPAYHYMLDHQLWIRLSEEAPFNHRARSWSAARYHPAAKNASQAAGFSTEIFRVLRWMESDLHFRQKFNANRRKILGGAYRLSGRYLLDAGCFGPSLRSYLIALFNRPGYALKHWARMLYGLASLIGLQGIAQHLAEVRRRRQPVDGIEPEWASWPGLQITPGSS